MGSTPLVSICIPTYNNAAMVADALRSVLNQTHTNLDIIVLDNHSADDTEQIVGQVALADVRIRYVRHQENIGMAGNFNAGITLARGEFIMVLCADDILEPDCVQELCAALSSQPEAVLVSCGRLMISVDLKPLGVVRARARREMVEGKLLIRECFVWGNRMGEPSAVMFRREACGRGFNGDYHQLIDMEMWFHLLEKGAAIFLPQPLSRIRRHGGQWTQTNIKNGRLIEDKQRMFRLVAPTLADSLSTQEKILWDVHMASSVIRWRSAGGTVDVRKIAEVFFRPAFNGALLIVKFAGLLIWFFKKK